MTWVFLDDERRGIELPDDLVASGVIHLPGPAPPVRFTESASVLLPAPVETRVYWRSYPRRYEYVLTETVTLRRGDPLSEGEFVYASAIVFERR